MIASRPQRRDRALCCQCGEVRTVSHSFRGRSPDGARDVDLEAWCRWLRCAHCGKSTVHAVVADVLADEWGREGCDREQRDRRADRDRRRAERRLRAIAADGVLVVRTHSAGAMSVINSIVELVEYPQRDAFVMRVRVTAEPRPLLLALDSAEELLDQFCGPRGWAAGEDHTWRGMAITDPRFDS